MWVQFWIAVVAIIALLVIPGYLSLRSLGMPRAWAACSAPLLSIALICVVGQLLAWAGITATPLTVLTPVVAVPAVCAIVLRNRVHEMHLPHMAWWIPVAFVAVGMALGVNLIVMRLGSPDTLFESYDLTKHLNLIQSITDSGRFSSLGTSAYLSSADSAIAPIQDTGFYPAAWHVLCAIVVQVTGTTSAIVINASMLAFASVVYPLSMACLLTLVFDGRRRAMLIGAVVTLSFVMFPWALLTFGPVYPNVAGLAVIPVVVWLFMHMTSPDEEIGKGERVRTLVAFVLCLGGEALLHPSTLFTAMVLLIPWCCHVILKLAGPRARKGLGLVAAFLVACAAFWCVCYKLPFLQDLVSHEWPAFANSFQEVVNILCLTYANGFYYEVAAQYLLGAVVVIGLVRAFHDPERRWLAISYLLTCLICFVSATREGTLKHLVAGFWYTDPMRLGAMAAIAAVPVAVYGMDWVVDGVCTLARRYNEARAHAVHPVKVGVVTMVVFAVVVFMPNFQLPGAHSTVVDTKESLEQKEAAGPYDNSTFHTTFGDYRANAKFTYTAENPLGNDEKAFLARVSEVVGPDDLVINDPMDGSFLAYGYDGLRVYYRDFVGFGNGESGQSVLIRNGLADIATDDEVRTAVDEIGASYVLVLDQSGSDCSFINLRKDYRPVMFEGISSITDDTPGFETVLSDGNMRLYRIVS